MINVLIITHGEFGREMLKTAENIVGKQENVHVLGVTQGDSLTTMRDQTEAVLKAIDGTAGTLVLTDMLGGTPCNACLPLCTGYHVAIVSGLNLYMLLTAFIQRNNMELEDLCSKVISDGRKNIANAKELFLKRLQ